MRKKALLALILVGMIALLISSCSEEKKSVTPYSNAKTVITTEESIETSQTAIREEINITSQSGVKLSKEEIQKIQQYWSFNQDWSFSMPCNNGYGDIWYVGLGNANEWGIGIPYQYLGTTTEPALDFAALSFTTITKIYYDGLHVMALSDFRDGGMGDDNFAPNYYISTTQPDCQTSRGIRVGNTIDELQDAYPEAYENEGYWTDFNVESGIVDHDNCWVYAPEGSNRSILFLIKNNIIVQIDLADGLDGQITSPSWTGKYIPSEINEN